VTIALLCPSKGRPQQFRRMAESASKTAGGDFLIFPSVPRNEFPIYGITNKHIIKEQIIGMPTVQQWNELAISALWYKECKLFMLAADDMIFSTPLWDKALIDHYNALENKIHVYALRDSRDENGTPHIIVTREYIEAMGYFLPPLFLHWFVDAWTVEIAKMNNCFTHLKEYMLIHDKPSDRGAGDATHTGIRSMGWHERDKWVAETMRHVMFHEGYRLRSVIQGMTNPGSIPLSVKE
jgi:hypothetical protein